MKNNNLTPGEWEKIIINRAFGMSTEENAKAMELTRNGVLNVLNAFDCVKEQDWARACNLIVSRSMNIEVFKWSAEKCGVELPEIVVKAYEDYKEKRRAEKAAKMAEAQKAPEPVLPPCFSGRQQQTVFHPYAGEHGQAERADGAVHGRGDSQIRWRPEG